jgi:hypothetical protein
VDVALSLPVAPELVVPATSNLALEANQLASVYGRANELLAVGFFVAACRVPQSEQPSSLDSFSETSCMAQHFQLAQNRSAEPFQHRLRKVPFILCTVDMNLISAVVPFLASASADGSIRFSVRGTALP